MSVYCIPVEAKKNLEMKDMAQLAECQATLGCGIVKKYVSMGLLLDEWKVRFLFSPWAYGSGLLVPIMLVSPVVSWREGPIISRAICVAISPVALLSLGFYTAVSSPSHL